MASFASIPPGDLTLFICVGLLLIFSGFVSDTVAPCELIWLCQLANLADALHYCARILVLLEVLALICRFINSPVVV